MSTKSWSSTKTSTIVGHDTSLRRSKVSLQFLFKMIKREGSGIFLRMQWHRTNWRSTKIHIFSTFLHTYQDIFQHICSLSPQRTHYHSITPQEGANLVNIRLYCYPHFQKNEIEKLLHGIWKVSIIQPLTSPFSSPILLVKKKDGSWRL